MMNEFRVKIQNECNIFPFYQCEKSRESKLKYLESRMMKQSIMLDDSGNEIEIKVIEVTGSTFFVSGPDSIRFSVDGKAIKL